MYLAEESPIVNMTRFILGTFPDSQMERGKLIEKAIEKAIKTILHEWPGGLHDYLINLNAFGMALDELTDGNIQLNAIQLNMNDAERIARRVVVVDPQERKKGAYNPSFLVRDSRPLKLYALAGYCGGCLVVTDGDRRFITMTTKEALKWFMVPDHVIPGYTEDIVIAYSFSCRRKK